MNKWTVLDHIRKFYMTSGRLPSRIYLEHEFPDVPKEVLEEAIREFEQTIGEAIA